MCSSVGTYGGDIRRCLRESEHMRKSWLEVGSQEEFPCVPLGGLIVTGMPSELQLACGAVWVHPLIEGAAVSTATEQV